MKHKTKIKWILILIVIGYILSGLYTSYARAMAIQRSNSLEERLKMAQIEEKARIDAMSVKELIDAYGGSQSRTIEVIARCESGLRMSAINYNDGSQGSHSYYLMQFKIGTWKHFTKMMGEELNMDSAYDQIRVAKFMLDNDYGHHWSCYTKMKKSGIL